jgi:L-histidine Nalpha-methyltransferase
MIGQDICGKRLRLYRQDVRVHKDSFAQDVAQGLAAPRKWLLPKYFYDARGSQLYEQICALPEYYPYRAEREILASYAAEMHTAMGHLSLVELGPGNAMKTRYLLAEYERTGRPFVYCPVDISLSMLKQAAEQLLEEFSHLSIQALHADFTGNPGVIRHLPISQKAIAFFGSSMGNITPKESVDFLRQTAAIMQPEDVLLVGLDLKKSAALLVPAYNDSQGVTAAFNLNLLHRINGELGGNFDPQNFEHVALYNKEQGRIEMHLRSRKAQQATIAATGQVVTFAAGETIHTENSYKYSVDEVRDMGRRANLVLSQTWFDDKGYFLVGLFRPLSSS